MEVIELLGMAGKDGPGLRSAEKCRQDDGSLALISEGKDPSAYTFSGVEAVLPSAEVPLVDAEKSGVHENQASEPAPENSKAEEVVSEEFPVTTRKETGDSDPYVVHIEEPEEDLDYDLKSECVISKEAETCTEQGKVGKDILTKDSDNAVQQVKAKSTKAADLKQHFSAHGKVLSAKILASTRSRGCFGFLKMASGEDAASCILNLDGTEFNGTVIKVEVTDKEPLSSKTVSKSASNPNSAKDVRKRVVRRRFRGAPYLSMLSRRPGAPLDSTRRYYRPYVTAHPTRTVNRASRYLSRSVASTTSRGLEYLRRPVQSPRPRPPTTPSRHLCPEGYPVRHSPSESRPSPKVRIDYSVPRARERTPTRLVQKWPGNSTSSGRFRNYSPGSRPSEDSRRTEVSTRHESNYFRRSSPVFTKLTSRSSPSRVSPRQEPTGHTSQFRHPASSSYHSSRMHPGNYVCTDRRGRPSERDSTASQLRYESTTRDSHPGYTNYKTERPPYDAYAYPDIPQSSDMRRSGERRGWRISSQGNIGSSRQSYADRSRSRSPVSPVRRHSQSRRDPGPPSWHRGINSSSDYISSAAASDRASYNSEIYGRKNNGSGVDQDYNRTRSPLQSQRSTSKSFSRVIDYGHRSDTSSAQWQPQSSGNYYNTDSGTGGSQWRSSYYPRPHY
ncbi:hypothetical protein SprV_0501884900 [Sparganum proliferum]